MFDYIPSLCTGLSCLDQDRRPHSAAVLTCGGCCMRTTCAPYAEACPSVIPMPCFHLGLLCTASCPMMGRSVKITRMGKFDVKFCMITEWTQLIIQHAVARMVPSLPEGVSNLLVLVEPFLLTFYWGMHIYRKVHVLRVQLDEFSKANLPWSPGQETVHTCSRSVAAPLTSAG